MSATLQDIARKHGKSTEEVRGALSLVGYNPRSVSAVAAIPDDIQQKLEAHWLSQTEAATEARKETVRPAQKRLVGSAEVVNRKRRTFVRPDAAKKAVVKKPSAKKAEEEAAAKAEAEAKAKAAAEAAEAAKAKAAAKAEGEKDAPRGRARKGAKPKSKTDAEQIREFQIAQQAGRGKKPKADEETPEPEAAVVAPQESKPDESSPTHPTHPTLDPTLAPTTSAPTTPASTVSAPATSAPTLIPTPSAKVKAVEGEKVEGERVAGEKVEGEKVEGEKVAGKVEGGKAKTRSKSRAKPEVESDAEAGEDVRGLEEGEFDAPSQTSRPRPMPMAGGMEDDDDARFRPRRGGRGTITIDEKVVRRRRRKRERQAPRPRTEAPENVHGFQLPASPVARTVRIPETISLQNLADQLAMKSSALSAKLRGMGAAVADPLDRDTAWLLVEELGHKAVAAAERDLEKEILPEAEAEGGEMRARPPVVTVMGHVDHGKTSLLDAFRKTRVAAGEAGGITQHIGAHQIKAKGGRVVTFIDTPGHELFTEMRARGARVTDLVILVVAADDGVKPQTLEAISHAKAAGVPMVVAASKMDKEDADLERVKRELAENDVLPEDWGGDAMVVPVSAETGKGLDDLLEAVVLQSEVLELRARWDCPGAAVVIEGRIDKGRGPVASVIVRQGVLRKGDAVLCGAESGKIRAMWDDAGRAVAEAGASSPVEVQGLSGLPESGAELRALADGRKAREVAELRGERERTEKLAENLRPPEDILAALAALDSARQELRLVVKADVSGSREALVQALSKISGEAGEVKILHSGVGGVSESDAHLADSSGAWVVAFNVRPDARARKLMEQRGVRMISGRVIYDVVEAAREALLGMLEPVVEERVLGAAEVLQVFPIAKVGNVAGCRVSEGVVRAGATARLLRGGKVVWRGEISSLRRFKESAQEVRAGDECGISLRRYNDAKAGDVVEVFEAVERVREI